MRKSIGFGLVLNFLLFGAAAAVKTPSPPPVATFSIVAYDAATGELGVAVQSRFFAVGTVVPWAKAGVGAIATQSYANTTYGPRGLAMLEAGMSAKQVLDSLTGSDELRARRQVGVIDAKGNAVTYTGDSCLFWAGGKTGKYYACQGNILAGAAVVDSMAAGFEASTGELADRLLDAMEAGQRQGGDSRGMQSMALLVVKKEGGYSGYSDRYIDLRVDDSPNPFKEMRRLLRIQKGIMHLNLAGRYSRENNLPQAVKEAELAVLADPASADCHYDYACYLSLSGKREESLLELRKALDLNPKMAGMAQKDSDLANARSAAGFTKIIEEAGVKKK